ncbi:MAG: Arylsulfatase [Verrucomicrobiota bacterium]
MKSIPVGRLRRQSSPSFMRVFPFLAVLLGFLSPLSLFAAERPNVVLLLADDLGIHDLGCYGRGGRRTPHLDRLARDGVRFTNAYAQAVCSPSRAALMTGWHPARLQITNYLPGRSDRPSHRLLQPALPSGLATDRPTVAERLRELGYATAIVGKWHLGEKPPLNPASRGFDLVHAGHAKGGEADKGDAETVRVVEAFLEANAKRPFFLYVPFHSPHIPIKAAEERVAANAGGFNPGYDAMIDSLDEAVGRIVGKIDALGLRENTLVVFASDNGGVHIPELQEAPPTFNGVYRAGKGFLYEGGIRDPLIVRWPGKVLPRVEEAVVSLGDFTPTVLDWVGVPVAGLDFTSLKPLLLGQGSLPERAMFWHMPNYTNQGGRPSGAIREGDWKLVEHYEDGRLELFDLKADPGERQEVGAREPGRVAAMRGKLEAWRREVGASMGRANPHFEPARWAACYEAMDVSQLEAKGKASEMMQAGLRAWREAMDAYDGRKGKGAAEAGGPRGLVILEARNAEVHGTRVKYETPAQKDTVGFWVDPLDWVSWDLEVPEAGRYAVEVLQGCGRGSAGSLVEVAVGEKAVRFHVEETGHFQRFVPRNVGVLELGAGKATLSVKPVEKKGGAVMDLRRVSLVRVP